MKKLVVLLFMAFILFFSGCEALSMSPDCWLDPDRWEQKDELVARQQLVVQADLLETGNRGF
jgi:hypothetical protein